MTHNPIISIIMPVKNNEKLLPYAVESVFSQKYHDWELIIMEGFSEDKTGEIAESYARVDDRVKVYHVDEWIYESINQGFFYAKGDYVTVLNSDDKLVDDALLIASDYIRKYDIDLFLCPVGIFLCDNNQNIIADNTPPIFEVFNKEVVLTDVESVRNNWIDIYFYSGLLQNQLNIYKKSTIEGIRFRNDYINADQLFNLEVLPRVESLAYYPKIMYQFFEYCDSGKLNASVGKFYDYHFDMCNELYYRALYLFANYGLDNENVKHLLREKRVHSFLSELDTYKFKSCNIPFSRIVKMIMSHANYLKDMFVLEGKFKELENKVISVIYELYVGLTEIDEDMTPELAELVVGIAEIYKIKGNHDIDINKAYRLIKSYYNPAHIGINILNEFLHIDA